MDNRKDSLSQEFNENSAEIFSKAVKEALISALVTAIATTLCTVVYGRVKHLYFDKPDLYIMLHNKSYIIEKTTFDSGEVGIRRNIYEGVQIVDGKKSDSRYILITGDPSDPGYITVVVRINNNGNLHATITDCELNIVEYKSLEGFEYAAHIIERSINPDKYVVLYGSVDTYIRQLHTIKAKIRDDGSIITSSQPLSERIQPKEYKNYYTKIKLSKHGIYHIQPVIHYSYMDKSDTVVPEQTIDIIYDRLDNRQLKEKRSLFKQLE